MVTYVPNKWLTLVLTKENFSKKIRSVFNENTDQFCVVKIRPVFNENSNQFLYFKKIRSIFNENTNQFCEKNQICI